MKAKLNYVAVDVDDKAFHVCVVSASNEIISNFQCSPQATRLAEKLALLGSKASFRVCYEATYLGFSLQRNLTKLGFCCEVVAPSLIPTLPGKKIKTDRLDCQHLARCYAQGLLTTVTVPDEELEADRALLRSDAFISDCVRRYKNHIISYCKRLGWNYEMETKLKSKWSKSHRVWLDRKIASCTQASIKKSLLELLNLLRLTEASLATFNEEVAILAAKAQYEKPVRALACIRGIETKTAMTIVAEIGDIHRFKHPRQLVSYVGLDIKEYSSGGKERKTGITKMGNVHIRRVLVEACQFALHQPRVSYKLATRRQQSSENMIQIGDRCMSRLHKKSTRLLYRGKPRNKIKTACAREMLGFIWEMMGKAA